MASILAMHAGHNKHNDTRSGANLGDYEQCPDSVDLTDDNSLEADGNLNGEKPEQTPFMNLITRGYNSIHVSEKTSDIKVFHVSKGKQIVRALRLFFKICCCILYVLQTLEFPETNNYAPLYCKNLHYLLPFNPVPEHNSVLNAYQREKCYEEFNYQLTDNFPFDQIDEPIVSHNIKSMLRFNNIAEMNNEVKSHFCSLVCNSTESCVNATGNEFYEFCSCIVDCAGQLICNSAVQHSKSFTKEIAKYDYSKLLIYPKPLPLYLVQAVFSLLVMVESIITCFWSYRNGVRCFKLIDGLVIIDLVNGILFILTFLFPPCLKDLFIPIFLQCLSARILLNEIIYEFDTYTVPTKWMNVLTQKLISLLFTICSVLFVSVCLMHYLERTHSDSSIPNLFESLWFIIITITTVGYGDIYPQTWYGKIFIMILVILVLFSLTTVLDELLELLGSSHKTTSAYFNYVKGKHVVLVTSNVKMNFLVDFLNELYSEESNDLVTVILCPRSPDKMTENGLKSPVWRRRIVLLQGSALRFIDLERACVANAKYCFLIPDRQTEDPNATDQEIILRAIAIRRFAPRLKLYVHILKPENRFHVDFATKIMCEGEIKHALFASNCICPGFSSFMTLLLHTTSPDPDEKNQDYSYCSGNEIYDIRLGDSKLFSQYVNKNFLFTAVLVLRNSGVLLIGIRRGENRRILLNPGSDYILQENDICFYISQNREELSRVVEKVPKYEAKNELEKMCAQVGLINMHYYNMEQGLQNQDKCQLETSISPKVDSLVPTYNTTVRRESLQDSLIIMQAAANKTKVLYKYEKQDDAISDDEDLQTAAINTKNHVHYKLEKSDDANSDDECIGVSYDPGRRNSLRESIMMLQAAASKGNCHTKHEKKTHSNIFTTSTSDKLDECTIPLQGAICPEVNSVFSEPAPNYDPNENHCDYPEFQITDFTDRESECNMPDKCPESGIYRPYHSYSPCNYPRRKAPHHVGKKLAPESTHAGGLSKLLRPQSQMNKDRVGGEGAGKKKILLKGAKGKLKSRMSKLNLFDTPEPPQEGLAIHDEQEKNELDQLEDNTNFASKFEPRPEPEPITKTKHSLGVPPVRPYIGSSNINCHLISPATRQCCLQLGWKIQCHDNQKFKPTREQFRPEDPCPRKLYPFQSPNAIILAADDAGPQLYHFILPLRSQYLDYDQLLPIVLLIPSHPESAFLEAISWLPQVYFIVGSADSVDDLLIAGVLNANAVIVCVGDGIHEEKDEIHMTDASRLNIVLKMRKVFPNTPFYVELFHRSNIRFLPSKIQGSRMRRRNPDDFLSTPYFKSGHVFSPSMLDTIIYQSAKKDYIIELVRLMLGLEQREGSAYLAKVELSQNDVTQYQNYGRIMQKLAYDRKDLAIGIYRTEMHKQVTRNETLRYERVQEFLQFKLREFNIENVEIPTLPNRSKNSYVLVNPAADLCLFPDDIILVLRCNEIKTTAYHNPPLKTIKSFPQGISVTESDTDSEADSKKSTLNKLKRSFTFKSRDDGSSTKARNSTVSESANDRLSEAQTPKIDDTISDAIQKRSTISTSRDLSDRIPSPSNFLDLSPLDGMKSMFNFRKTSYEPISDANNEVEKS